MHDITNVHKLLFKSSYFGILTASIWNNFQLSYSTITQVYFEITSANPEYHHRKYYKIDIHSSPVTSQVSLN